MRQVLSWVVVAAFVPACGSSPVSPTVLETKADSVQIASVSRAPSLRAVSGGYFDPWFFPVWQPGLGEPLAPGVTTQSTVENGELCIPILRTVWDARASCRLFRVSVPESGILAVFLEWDITAAGFDLALAGDVVLVKPTGQFKDSDWQQGEVHTYAFVEPGDYGVIVMSYTPATLPFQIRVELSQ